MSANIVDYRGFPGPGAGPFRRRSQYVNLEDMIMTLKPMADNVLLKAHEEQTSVAGILIAASNKEKPAIYEVVAVGPGTKDVPMTVKPGEKVIVGKFTGTDVTLDKTDYKFVKLEDILAVVAD